MLMKLTPGQSGVVHGRDEEEADQPKPAWRAGAYNCPETTSSWSKFHQDLLWRLLKKTWLF